MHYLTEYQTFQSKQQLNDAIADHLTAHRYELTDTVRNVLTVVSRYAVKFPGVAHLKASTIAEAIGMSEKTVRRALNRLQALRIIKKVATTRKVSGGKGANIVQLLPFDQSQVSSRPQAVEPTEPSVESIESKNEPYNSIKPSNTYNKRTSKPAWIPQAFFDLLNAHFDEKEITDYWRAVHTTTYRLELAPATKEQIAIESFYEMKSRRRKLRKPIAYFVGVVKRKAKRAYITDLYNGVISV